jgi:hypothetical protein
VYAFLLNDPGHLSVFPTTDLGGGKREVEFTRKLCPYPAVATYMERGDQKLAAHVSAGTEMSSQAENADACVTDETEDACAY